MAIKTNTIVSSTRLQWPWHNVPGYKSQEVEAPQIAQHAPGDVTSNSVYSEHKNTISHSPTHYPWACLTGCWDPSELPHLKIPWNAPVPEKCINVHFKKQFSISVQFCFISKTPNHNNSFILWVKTQQSYKGLSFHPRNHEWACSLRAKCSIRLIRYCEVFELRSALIIQDLVSK